MSHTPGQRTLARILTSTAAAALALVLTACGGTDDQPAAAGSGDALSKLDLTFTVSSTSLAHQLIYAARDGGYLEKYNINAKFVTADSSSVAMAALASGSAQVAFVGRVDPLLTTAQGKKMVYIYKHSTGFLTNVTVSKAFADKHPGYESMSLDDRLKALNGATIAQASANGVLTRVLDSAMKGVGAATKNTYIATNTMTTALARGSVDGYMAPSPFQETSVQAKQGVTWIKGTDLPDSGGESIVQGATAVSEDYLKSNRANVVRVIAALQATAEGMKADPDKAKKIAQERLKTTDPAIFDVMWPAAYTCIIGPLQHPISADDITFMIKHDAADTAAAQSLDPAAQIAPPDVVTDAKALAQRIGH
ncbi:ABC transporter substrate-binding protein [Dactylosporangium sp. CS-047395]|uniref:ABC transporter substrate-binding protein n=1 Tax=Dactylosporangium sp. CS-047395 TaxID=3239936 RepID=UPI003D93BAEA